MDVVHYVGMSAYHRIFTDLIETLAPLSEPHLFGNSSDPAVAAARQRFHRHMARRGDTILPYLREP